MAQQLKFKKKSDLEGKTPLTIWLDVALHSRVKAYCVRQGFTMRSAFSVALEEYLDRKEKKLKKKA